MTPQSKEGPRSKRAPGTTRAPERPRPAIGLFVDPTMRHSLLGGISNCLGEDTGLRSNTEELNSIVPCQVRDRDHSPLFPQQTVRKSRNVAHVDSGAYNAPPLRTAFVTPGMFSAKTLSVASPP